MLEIRNIEVKYGTNTIIRNLNLNVGEDEIVVMVGESGSGKSTLVRSVMGLLSHGGKLAGGEILFEGRSLNTLSDREYRSLRGNEIAMVFQQPERSLDPTITIGRQFYEAVKVHRRIAYSEVLLQAEKLLKVLGFKEGQQILDKYPFELSGGMCQRVAIALSVINEPKLLLADEPTSALDVVIQKQTLDMLKEMRENLHMSILLVTHNMGVVSYMADKVGVMHHGHLVEWGTREEILKDPQHVYTRELIRAIPTMDGELPQYNDTIPMKHWKHQKWFSETHWALME